MLGLGSTDGCNDSNEVGAARTPDLVDELVDQRHLPIGYNHPNKKGQISAYLPGNGGILIAVGLMAGGWENGPKREAPGFPKEWNVEQKVLFDTFRPNLPVAVGTCISVSSDDLGPAYTIFLLVAASEPAKRLIRPLLNKCFYGFKY